MARSPLVADGPVAVTGYCMGARLSLLTAGAHPERVAAAAGFHGGRLATEAPDSPHLVALPGHRRAVLRPRRRRPRAAARGEGAAGEGPDRGRMSGTAARCTRAPGTDSPRPTPPPTRRPPPSGTGRPCWTCSPAPSDSGATTGATTHPRPGGHGHEHPPTSGAATGTHPCTSATTTGASAHARPQRPRTRAPAHTPGPHRSTSTRALPTPPPAQSTEHIPAQKAAVSTPGRPPQPPLRAQSLTCSLPGATLRALSTGTDQPHRPTRTEVESVPHTQIPADGSGRSRRARRHIAQPGPTGPGRRPRHHPPQDHQQLGARRTPLRLQPRHPPDDRSAGLGRRQRHLPRLARGRQPAHPGAGRLDHGPGGRMGRRPSGSPSSPAASTSRTARSWCSG